MSTPHKKSIPESETDRKAIRLRYRELIERGSSPKSAARALGYSRMAMYRMFIMDNDPWRVRYSPYDEVSAILRVRDSGKPADEACKDLGIPYYKYQDWVKRYGETPAPIPEPKNRMQARLGNNRWSAPSRRPVGRPRKIAAKPKVTPNGQPLPGILGQMWNRQATLEAKINTLDARMEEMLRYLGIKEIKEGL